ncbi:type II toxin-antitoxin system RelE family toxin [Frankia sp. Cas4]
MLRLRVGDYRVIYHVEDARLVVTVIRMAHRSEVYRGP